MGRSSSLPVAKQTDNATIAAVADLTKDDSMVIKGVAILAMMWHHCFLKGRFDNYALTFGPFDVGMVTNVAAFLKICVSLFAFVSGYGLYCSLRSKERGNLDTWYATRYIKTFSDYWLVVLLGCIASQLIDGKTYAIYFDDGTFAGIVYMALDFLGLGAIFETPQLIGSWWYMSAALMFTILAPFLFGFMKRYGVVACVFIVLAIPRVAGGFPGGTNWLSFFMAFVMGGAFAHTQVVSRIRRYAAGSGGQHALLLLGLAFLLAACYKFDRTMSTDLFWDSKWGVFVAVYVLVIVFTLARIPYVRDALVFCGKWSSHIYLIHTFFRTRYGAGFVYGDGFFLLVIVRLLAVTMVACVLFRLLKKAIRYDDMIAALLRRIKLRVE